MRTVRLSFVNVTLGKQVAQAGIIVIRVEALRSVQVVIGYKTSVRSLVIIVGGAGALRAVQQAGRVTVPGPAGRGCRGSVLDGVARGGMVAGVILVGILGGVEGVREGVDRRQGRGEIYVRHHFKALEPNKNRHLDTFTAKTNNTLNMGGMISFAANSS